MGLVVLLIAAVCCLFGFVGVVREITEDRTDSRRMIYVGLALGAVFGFMCVVIAAQAGHFLKQWYEARHGFRTERLMLKYHDQLKESSNKSVQATGEDARA
jgi:hypothetical protein